MPQHSIPQLMYCGEFGPMGKKVLLECSYVHCARDSAACVACPSLVAPLSKQTCRLLRSTTGSVPYWKEKWKKLKDALALLFYVFRLFAVSNGACPRIASSEQLISSVIPTNQSTLITYLLQATVGELPRICLFVYGIVLFSFSGLLLLSRSSEGSQTEGFTNMGGETMWVFTTATKTTAHLLLYSGSYNSIFLYTLLCLFHVLSSTIFTVLNSVRSFMRNIVKRNLSIFPSWLYE